MIAPQFKFFPEKKFLNKGSLIIAYQNIRESRIKRKFSSLDRQNQEEYLNLLSINGDFDFNIKNLMDLKELIMIFILLVILKNYY